MSNKPAKTPPRRRPLGWIEGELAKLDKAGLRRRLVERGAAQGPTTTVGGRELVNFSSNDYLGLAADSRVVAAAVAAAGRHGWGAGASPLVTGRSALHAELERRLAAFKGTEAALLFPTGFGANAGTVPALVDEGDAVFADAKNHASLIDGCRLSRAERFVYPHNDAAALDALLAEHQGFRRRLIVTDTLFSMDGDVAPVDELRAIADRHHAMLMVDEAHATGVLGEGGRGAASGADRKADVCVGTLSKALGSVGGFVVGSAELIDWLSNRARSYVFSTATPAAAAAAAIAALDAVEAEPSRAVELLAKAASLRGRLRSLGWSTGASASQIVPIIVGDPTETMRLAGRLREAGLCVPGIRPPSVPEGESLLRISLCHGHTAEHLDRLCDALGPNPTAGAVVPDVGARDPRRSPG